MLHIFLSIVAKGRGIGWVIRRSPEQDVSIVSRRSQQFAARAPPHHIDSLCVLLERRQVLHLPLVPVALDAPYPHVAVAACSCQAPFALQFKVGRIDGAVFVVPGNEQWCGFHRVTRAGSRPGTGFYGTKQGVRAVCVAELVDGLMEGLWRA